MIKGGKKVNKNAIKKQSNVFTNYEKLFFDYKWLYFIVIASAETP